jgi:hypothetical protein
MPSDFIGTGSFDYPKATFRNLPSTAGTGSYVTHTEFNTVLEALIASRAEMEGLRQSVSAIANFMCDRALYLSGAVQSAYADPSVPLPRPTGFHDMTTGSFGAQRWGEGTGLVAGPVVIPTQAMTFLEFGVYTGPVQQYPVTGFLTSSTGGWSYAVTMTAPQWGIGLMIAHNNTGSTAGHRIHCPGGVDYYMKPGSMLELTKNVPQVAGVSTDCGWYIVDLTKGSSTPKTIP